MDIIYTFNIKLHNFAIESKIVIYNYASEEFLFMSDHYWDAKHWRS